MRESFVDCTVLTVAHRIGTIREHDAILVLDAGSVVEYGPPDELLKKEGGAFRALAERELLEEASMP